MKLTDKTLYRLMWASFGAFIVFGTLTIVLLFVNLRAKEKIERDGIRRNYERLRDMERVHEAPCFDSYEPLPGGEIIR